MIRSDNLQFNSNYPSLALRSLAFASIFSCIGTVQPTSEFGADRLLALNTAKATVKLPTNSPLPSWKIQSIFNDPAVVNLKTDLFAWVDLANKNVHVFSRQETAGTWSHDRTLKCNPGVPRYNSTLRTRISITPVGDYLVHDQGNFRRSRAYGNAPMPYYSRLWDPSQKPSFDQSGIFFHVGKLDDAGSHGCVRLDEQGAIYIKDTFKKGDRVFIRRS